jgi:hypothetical protein
MIPGAPQVFPAYGPFMETVGIEPTHHSRHGLNTFSLQKTSPGTGGSPLCRGSRSSTTTVRGLPNGGT